MMEFIWKFTKDSVLIIWTFSLVLLILVSPMAETQKNKPLGYPRGCSDRIFCRFSSWRDHCESDIKLKKEYIRKRCPCTCDINHRFNSCCGDLGMSPECQPLCSYNVTIAIFLAVPKYCLDEMHVWGYCAAQQKNHKRCCKKGGIPTNSLCYSVCDKGRLPKACTIKKKLALKGCAFQYYSNMVSCFKSDIPKLPKWNKNTKVKSLNERCKLTSAEVDCFFDDTCNSTPSGRISRSRTKSRTRKTRT